MSILATLPRGSILKPEPQATGEASEALRTLSEQLEATLTEPQRQVYEAKERFKLLCSGRRFGKTYLLSLIHI